MSENLKQQSGLGAGGVIRPARGDENRDILRIINAAAVAYRGVIPFDRWHEPYMPGAELAAEVDAGVVFAVYQVEGQVVGVIGLQPVRNVHLIRHAYVLPAWQGRGVGGALLINLLGVTSGPILVGTWRAAVWAIRFYEQHGFSTVPDAAVAPLLRTYWTVPDRQIETSVVLASPALSMDESAALVRASTFSRHAGVSPGS